MKIKKSQLKQLIKEEVVSVLLEQGSQIAGVGFPHQDPRYYDAYDHLQRQQEIDDIEAHNREYAERAYRGDTEMRHTLSADTAPQDYGGLRSFTRDVVPFGETATTLLNPRQGWPSGEQVVSDVGWEALGAAVPFVPGQKFKKGWEWLRSRMPGTPDADVTGGLSVAQPVRTGQTEISSEEALERLRQRMGREEAAESVAVPVQAAEEAAEAEMRMAFDETGQTISVTRDPSTGGWRRIEEMIEREITRYFI